MIWTVLLLTCTKAPPRRQPAHLAGHEAYIIARKKSRFRYRIDFGTESTELDHLWPILASNHAEPFEGRGEGDSSLVPTVVAIIFVEHALETLPVDVSAFFER